MLLSAARDFVRMQARSGTDTNLYTDALVDRALWLAASEFQRRIKYLRWVVDGGTVTPVTVNEVVVGRYSASQMLLPADLSGVVAYYGSRDLRPLRIVTEAALWTIVAQGINEYVAAVVDSDPTKLYVYPLSLIHI